MCSFGNLPGALEGAFSEDTQKARFSSLEKYYLYILVVGLETMTYKTQITTKIIKCDPYIILMYYIRCHLTRIRSDMSHIGP